MVLESLPYTVVLAAWRDFLIKYQLSTDNEMDSLYITTENLRLLMVSYFGCVP